jgi:hypothetical protein
MTTARQQRKNRLHLADNPPSATKDGLVFFPIPSFDDASVAFGADASRYFDRRNLPDVPREFEDAANNLFFSGGSLPAFDPRVDPKAAMRMTRALLSSFAPSHEAKETTVGYAFWVWSSKEAIDTALETVAAELRAIK